MKVKDYVDIVTAAERTRANLAIFDPGAGYRRRQELYSRLEAAKRVFVQQFGSGNQPPMEAELNPALRRAATPVLEYIISEELLATEGIEHCKMFLS